MSDEEKEKSMTDPESRSPRFKGKKTTFSLPSGPSFAEPFIIVPIFGPENDEEETP